MRPRLEPSSHPAVLARTHPGRRVGQTGQRLRRTCPSRRSDRGRLILAGHVPRAEGEQSHGSQEQLGARTAELMAERDAWIWRAGSPRRRSFVERAHGARLIDVDGREYIDFVGGIGVLNGGHTPERVVAAIQEQAEKYLHQCFSIAAVRAVPRGLPAALASHPGDGPYKGAAGQLGRRGRRERRQDRPLPHRARRGDHRFDHGFHGRTLLAMTPDLEGDAVQEGLRPVRARGLPRAGAVPVPRHRHARTRWPGSRLHVQGQVDP